MIKNEVILKKADEKFDDGVVKILLLNFFIMVIVVFHAPDFIFGLFVTLACIGNLYRGFELGSWLGIYSEYNKIKKVGKKA